jgi:hypothetical protein
LFLKENVLLNNWISGSLPKLEAFILVELVQMMPQTKGVV